MPEGLKSDGMNKQVSIVLVFGFFLAISCKKNSTTPVTPVIPGSATNLTGKVNLYDDKGIAITDKSGVSVTISNRYNDSVFTITTDTSGSYTFVSKVYGVYDIEFSKSTLGTLKVPGFTHYYNPNTPNSPNIVPVQQLGALSTTEITAVTYVDSTYNGLPGSSFTLTVSTDPSTNNRAYFRCFLSSDSALDNTHYTAYTTVRSIISNNATFGFTHDDLVNGLGFITGQTVYLRVYGESVQSNDYFDDKTGKRVFPNLNPSSPQTISFKVL